MQNQSRPRLILILTLSLSLSACGLLGSIREPDTDQVVDPSTTPPGGSDEETTPSPFDLNVLETIPNDSATDIDPQVTIEIEVEQTLDPDSINTSTITLENESGIEVEAAASYDVNDHRIVLIPTERLALDMNHIVKIKKGIKDEEGAEIQNPITFSFHTRNGSWTPPQELDGKYTSAYDHDLAINNLGKVISIWRNGGGVGTRWFSPKTGWTEVEDACVSPNPGSLFYNGDVHVDINDNGDAAATFRQRGISDDNLSRGGTAYTEEQGWSECILLEDENGEANYADIAIEEEGSALVVYSHYFDGKTHMIAKRHDLESGWSANSFLSDPEADSNGDPAVAVDNDGNFIAIWQRSDPDTARTDLIALRFVKGFGWGAPTMIESDNGFSSYVNNTAISMNQDGKALVSWKHRPANEVGVPFETWVNFFDPTNGWGMAGKINSGNNNALGGKPALNNRGNALNVWLEELSSGQVLQARKWDSEAANWTEIVNLSDSLSGEAFASVTALNNRDQGAVAWIQTSGTANFLYLSQRQDETWTTPLLIDSSPEATIESPKLVMDDKGYHTLTWLNDETVKVSQFE